MQQQQQPPHSLHISAVRLPVDLPNWPELRKLLLLLRQNDGKTSTLMRALDQLHASCVGGTTAGAGRSRSCFAGLGRFLESCLRPDERRQFFGATLPFIVDRVLALETHRETLNYSRQNLPVAAMLSRSFVSSLLASAFLCLMPPHPVELREILSDNSFAPFFAGILSASSYQAEKLRCILAYFEELHRRSSLANQLEIIDEDNEKLLIVRSVLDPGLLLAADQLAASCQPLCPILLDSEAPIDQADASLLHVNFGSCLLGGTALRTGVGQEEVNFCVHPELLVTQLFMEAMDSNEAVFVFGYEPFSAYSGSGAGFRFTGRLAPSSYCYSSSTSTLLERCLVSMDALPFIWCQHEQYYECNLMRELNKAFVGFRQSFASVPKQTPQAPDSGPLSMLEQADLAGSNSNQGAWRQSAPAPHRAFASAAVVIDWTNRRRSSGAASSTSSSTTPSWLSGHSSSSRRSSSRASSQVNASELEELLLQGPRASVSGGGGGGIIVEEAIIEAAEFVPGNGHSHHTSSDKTNNHHQQQQQQQQQNRGSTGLGSVSESSPKILALQRRRNSSPLRRPPNGEHRRRQRRRRLSARRDSSPRTTTSSPTPLIDEVAALNSRRRAAAADAVAASLTDSVFRDAIFEAANALSLKNQRNKSRQKKKTKRASFPTAAASAAQLLSVDACGNLTEPRYSRLADRLAEKAVSSALLVLRHRAVCPSRNCCQRRRQPSTPARTISLKVELDFIDSLDSLAGRLSRRILDQAMAEAAQVYTDSVHCHELANWVPRGVATGNWGCDSNGGDPQLKSLLQWMAASLNQLPVFQYHTLGNSRMAQFDELSSRLQSRGWSIGHVWRQVQAYSQLALKEQERTDRIDTSLFGFLLAQLQ